MSVDGHPLVYLKFADFIFSINHPFHEFSLTVHIIKP